MSDNRSGLSILESKRLKGVERENESLLAFNSSGEYLPYDDDKKVRLFFDQGGGYVPVLAMVLTSVG